MSMKSAEDQDEEADAQEFEIGADRAREPLAEGRDRDDADLLDVVRSPASSSRPSSRPGLRVPVNFVPSPTSFSMSWKTPRALAQGPSPFGRMAWSFFSMFAATWGCPSPGR